MEVLRSLQILSYSTRNDFRVIYRFNCFVILFEIYSTNNPMTVKFVSGKERKNFINVMCFRDFEVYTEVIYH